MGGKLELPWKPLVAMRSQDITQPVFTASKSTKETPDQSVKFVQS